MSFSSSSETRMGTPIAAIISTWSNWTGIYDWYLYFNTYAEWTKHCMDKRFKGKMFHRRGKELAKVLRQGMDPADELFYFRSIDDDSGVVMKKSRVKMTTKQIHTQDDPQQLTLPLEREL